MGVLLRQTKKSIWSGDPAGTTPVAAANELHRALDWDRETLERLATDLFNDRKTAVRTKPADVRAALRKLGPDDVDGERAQMFVTRQREKAEARCSCRWLRLLSGCG